MSNRLRSTGSFLSLGMALAFIISISLAGQTTDNTKKRTGKFGSSLKRLTWDAKSKRLIDKPDKNSAESNAGQNDEFQLATELVACETLVTDRNQNLVSGLTKEDFIVKEDNQPQEIGTFAHGDDRNLPRSIVLVIDWSRSQSPYIANSVTAAKTLVDRLEGQDEMAIVTDDVDLMVDYTQDKKRLKSALDTLKKRTNNGEFGESRQFTALYATLRELIKSDQRRHLIVFQTDGDEIWKLRNAPVVALPDGEKIENNRCCEPYSIADIYAQAEKTPATIYTVVPGFRLINLTPEQRRARQQKTEAALSNRSYVNGGQSVESNMLLRIKHIMTEQTAVSFAASITGGWTGFLEEPDQADQIYRRIFNDITSRYIIGYYPSNTARDGKRRTIKIEVRGHPEYTVQSRKGYIAPKAS